MTNNKGFTLIEVVVAIALSSVVLLSVTVITVTSQRTYTSLYNTVNLQYNTQILNSQLEQTIINCNGVIYYNKDTLDLCVVNFNKDGTNTLHSYKVSNAAMYYFTMQSTPLTTSENYSEFLNNSAENGGKMSEDIDSFEVLSQHEGQSTDKIQLNITFKNTQKQLGINLSIALKNEPYFTDDKEDLLIFLTK